MPSHSMVLYSPDSTHSSAIRGFYDAIRGRNGAITGTVGGENIAVAAGVPIATGAALGALNANGHLDINGKVPGDLIGGLLALIAGRASHSHVLKNAGKTALGVFSFRTTNKLLATKSATHGDFGAETSTKSKIDQAAELL